MTDFVLNASITMAWCFPDEETPETRGLFVLMPAMRQLCPLFGRSKSRMSCSSANGVNVLRMHRRRNSDLLRTFAITVDPAIADDNHRCVHGARAGT